MKNKLYKNAIIVAGLVVLALLGLGRYYAAKKSEQPLPKLSRRTAEAQPSAEFLNAQKAVEFYETAIRHKPQVAKNYIDLANVFLQESRATGNPHEYIPKAQEMLDAARRLEPENFEALLAQASIKLTLHRFQEAKRLAQIAIVKNPYSAFAYGALVDAHTGSGS